MRLFGQIFVLTAICLVSLKSFAQAKLTPVNPGPLLVVLDETSAKGIIDAEDFKTICERFGAMLTIDQGVFGLGVFTEVKCNPEVPGKLDNLIRLKVKFEGAEARLTFELATMKNPGRRLAEVTFKHAGKFKDLMENPTFAALNALTLLEQLPYQIVLRTGKNKRKKHLLSEAEITLLADGVKIPQTMYAFRAAVDDTGLFYPNNIGAITPSTQVGKSAYLHDNSSKKNKSISWNLSAKTKKMPAFVLGLDSEGRSASKGKLKEMITAKSGALVSEINQNLLTKSARNVSSMVGKFGSSGYLGLRYGPALLAGDLIDQSKYFGAVIEFRSGLLDGLRMYYDYWPEVTGTINGQDGTFGGKRAIIAYSFALKFDSWLRKIDLTPKIGVWSFRSKAPIEIEPGVYVSPEFEVKRAPSFDIEMGIETGSSIHILRGWASRAASVLNTASKDGANIASTRAGLDLLLSPWGTTSPVTISLLSFYFFEAVELKKSQKIETDEAEIDQLNYSQAYAGAGVAISW